MKAFAFGVIVGVIGCLAVIRIADPGAQPLIKSEQPPVRSNPHIDADPTRPASAAPGERLTPLLPTQRSSQRDVETPDRLTFEDLTEEEATDLCFQASNLRQRREQARKDAEPKDAGWAYSTEQMIRQHIESHVPRDQYTKLRIECRSTFCELRMEGRSEEGRRLAEAQLNDIPHQPWSDIVFNGQGGGSGNGNWYVDYEWHRPSTQAERQLRLQLRSQP